MESFHPRCVTLSSTPPHIPARLSQDTQEQETTQGRPWLTKIFRHSTSPIIIYYPPSTFTHVWLHTKSPGHNLWKQTKRKKKIHASKHPFIHPLHPINRSLVVWLHLKFHEELRTLTTTASRKLAHPTTAFWLILATGSSVSRFH